MNSVVSGRMADFAAVVTGGAGDIGSAAARRLRAAGARVVTWDREPERPAPDSGAGPGAAGHVICDVTRMDAVHEALKVTQERIGTPDLVVNAVGVGQLSGFLETPADTWDRIIEVNLLGSVNVIRGVLPGMMALRRGTIVNICSIWSKAAGVDRSAYIGAKWGLLGVTKCLAEEYRAAGVSICAVSPGPVLTRMTTKMAPADASNWLDPEQVAEAIETVASGGRVFSGSEVEVFGAARPSGMHSHR